MKFLALLLTAAALAQAPSQDRQLQTLILTVNNKAGQFVTNMKQEDFIVEEDGARQEVSKFTAAQEPLSLGILIDTSASMRLPVAVQGKEKVAAALLAADGAARVVVKLTQPQDEFLFMTFSDDFKVKQSFNSDKKKVTDLLYKDTTVGGSTHLYHAVGEALKEIRKKAKNNKRALIVLTDVHDTSGDKIEDLQSIVHEQEIPVYTFGMRWDPWGVPGETATPGKATYEEAVLTMIAADSGGHSMIVDIPDLLSDFTIDRMIAFVQLIELELRGQYALSYYSSTPGSAAGKVVRVRTVYPDLEVRYRRLAAEKAASKK